MKDYIYYKYIALFIIIALFLTHQQILSTDGVILYALALCYIFIVLDYAVVEYKKLKSIKHQPDDIDDIMTTLEKDNQKLMEKLSYKKN
jgi:hypothetical protein